MPGNACITLLCTAGDSSPSMNSGLDSELSSRTADAFSIAIVGDLHLEQKGMKTFHRARQQLKDVLSASGSGEPRVVQLGDLGGYSEKPGESSASDCKGIYPWHPAGQVAPQALWSTFTSAAGGLERLQQ